MKVILNKNESEINYPFEGFTYKIPTNTPVSVQDRFAVFIQGVYPWIEVSEENKEIPEIEKTQSVSFVKLRQDAPFGTELKKDLNPDGTPAAGTTDADGIEWTGDGIQVDTPTE